LIPALLIEDEIARREQCKLVMLSCGSAGPGSRCWPASTPRPGG
jgi:hypothetical protein